MISFLDATPFDIDEMSEFVCILKAGLNRATHRITRAEISEELDYFEPQMNALKLTTGRESRMPEFSAGSFFLVTNSKKGSGVR